MSLTKATYSMINGAPLNVLDFGADPTGGKDSTASIQAALDIGGDIYIPKGYYVVGPLTISKIVNLYGDGMELTHLGSTATGSQDALTISPTADNNKGYYLHDFNIYPTTAVGAGRYGIRIALNLLMYFSNSVIERVEIGDFGSEGLFLDNSVYSNGDGFFTTTIRRNWITNGIKMLKVGDSITVAENTITGSGVGVYITSLPGARQAVFDQNNITNSGGAFHAENIGQMFITNNQLECINGYSNPYGTDAFIYLKSCILTNIENNTITPKASSTPTPAASSIKVDTGCVETFISNNAINIGSTNHIYLAGTSITNRTNISANNRYFNFDAIVPPVILNNAPYTSGVFWANITPVNGWSALDAVNKPLQIVKTVDGVVMLSGALTGGTTTADIQVAYISPGFAPTTRLQFVVPNNNGGTWGTVILRISTTGSINIVNNSLSAPGNTEIDLSGISYFQQQSIYY